MSNQNKQLLTESTETSKQLGTKKVAIEEVITAKDMHNVIDKSNITTPLVAVYCGARMGAKPIYEETARALGTALAENGLGLVYGGASIGLMGAVADSAMAAKTPVVGVIPNFMLKKEVAHDGLTKLHLTDTMHTRKAIMAEYADAFITLPGGLGTLEEIMEIATWRQLYQHEKPMIILNIDGYYDRLIEHLLFSIDEGFVSAIDLKRLQVCNDIDSVIKALQASILIQDNFHVNKI